MTSPEDKSLQYWYKKARRLENKIARVRKEITRQTQLPPCTDTCAHSLLVTLHEIEEILT